MASNEFYGAGAVRQHIGMLLLLPTHFRSFETYRHYAITCKVFFYRAQNGCILGTDTNLRLEISSSLSSMKDLDFLAASPSKTLADRSFNLMVGSFAACLVVVTVAGSFILILFQISRNAVSIDAGSFFVLVDPGDSGPVSLVL